MSLHLDRRAAELAVAVKTAEYPDDMLLTTEEVAAWLGVHPVSVKRWHHQGEGPKATRAGLRALRFKKADVAAWLEKRSTAKPGA